MRNFFSPLAIVNKPNKYPTLQKSGDVIDTFSQYVEKTIQDSLDAVSSDFGSIFKNSYSIYGSPVDQIKNEDGTLSVFIDVPGIKEADLNIEIKKQLISVSGKRKTAHSESSISKSFSIPTGYSEDDAQAELNDGVLTIKLQPLKIEQEQSKKILIKSKDK